MVRYFFKKKNHCIYLVIIPILVITDILVIDIANLFNEKLRNVSAASIYRHRK